jgi:hypothetical protein
MILALAVVLSQLDAGAEELIAPPQAQADAAAPADAPVADVGSPDPALSPSAPTATAEGVAPSEFVKGELSVYLGSDRLTVKRNRVAVSLGADVFLDTLYALIEPQLDLRFFDSKLGIGVGVPLRLEIFSFQDLFRNAGTIRKEDYDTLHDYGRLLKYVNYGKKEDNFYVNIGQRYATSIGHGAIMRRYAPNIDVDYPRASAEVDYYNDYAGFEAFTNDVLSWNVLSAIAFVKPFSFFKPQNLLLKSLSVGVTGAVDWNAPLALIYDANGARQMTTDNRLAATTAPVGLVGVDAEVKVVKTASTDIKPYLDYSTILGGGSGLTVGVLGRFNVGHAPVNAFRLVLEGRSLGDHYVPSYFDTFYEIDRYQARRNGFNAFGVANVLTKQQLVLGQGLGNRAGFYAEASWGIPNTVGVTVAFETTTGADPKNNFVAHLEVPWLNFLQIFGSFYKRGFKDVGEFARLDENTVIFAGARLRTLPFLFFNARFYKTFRINSDVQAYDNQLGFSLDVELGFEFGRSRAEAEEIQRSEAQKPLPDGSGTDAAQPVGPERPGPAEQPSPTAPVER